MRLHVIRDGWQSVLIIRVEFQSVPMQFQAMFAMPLFEAMYGLPTTEQVTDDFCCENFFIAEGI